MANLIGYVNSDRSTTTASRLASEYITVQAETWQGKVEVTLEKDGDFTVQVGPKHSSGQVALKGNVGNDQVLGRHVVGPDGRVYTEQSNGLSTRFRPVRMTRKVRQHARTHVL